MKLKVTELRDMSVFFDAHQSRIVVTQLKAPMPLAQFWLGACVAAKIQSSHILILAIALSWNVHVHKLHNHTSTTLA